MPLESEPLKEADAKKLAKEIVMDGTVYYTPYFLDRMKERGITEAQVHRALRGGWCDPAEWEKGEWRYRIQNTQIYVVIRFDSETELTCITTWTL
jgi:hypothetical protein